MKGETQKSPMQSPAYGEKKKMWKIHQRREYWFDRGKKTKDHVVREGRLIPSKQSY